MQAVYFWLVKCVPVPPLLNDLILPDVPSKEHWIIISQFKPDQSNFRYSLITDTMCVKRVQGWRQSLELRLFKWLKCFFLHLIDIRYWANLDSILLKPTWIFTQLKYLWNTEDNQTMVLKCRVSGSFLH